MTLIIFSILAVFYVINPFKILARKKLDKKYDNLIKAAESLIRRMYFIICTHYDTLKRKKSRKIYYDDYNNRVTKEWDREFEYFFSATILPQTIADTEIFNTLIEEFIKEINIYFKKYNLDYKEPLQEEGISSIVSLLLKKRSKLSGKTFLNLAQAAFLEIEANGICIEVDKLDKKCCNRCDISIEDCTAKEFEKRVADKLSEIGFMTEVTKYVGDQGADVLAEKNGVIFAIQCKLYSDSVGNKAVQEAISGKNYYKANYAVVVTNSHFTKQAHELADKTNSILLHYSDLDKLDEYCVEI